MIWPLAKELEALKGGASGDDIASAGAKGKVVELEGKLAEEQSTACQLCSMIILVQLVRLVTPLYWPTIAPE